MTLTPIAERLAVQLSLPVFTTTVYRGWGLNSQPSACGANALTDCDTAAADIDQTNSLYGYDDQGKVYQIYIFHDPRDRGSCAGACLYKLYCENALFL